MDSTPTDSEIAIPTNRQADDMFHSSMKNGWMTKHGLLVAKMKHFYGVGSLSLFSVSYSHTSILCLSHRNITQDLCIWCELPSNRAYILIHIDGLLGSE